MSTLDKSIRNVRYYFQSSDTLALVIETTTNYKIKLKPINGSINGLGCLTDGPIKEGEGIDLDAIIPYSKLICEGKEVTLGRLVIRRMSPQGDNIYIAFSSVDLRIPLEGVLSKYISNEVNGTDLTHTVFHNFFPSFRSG
jgi:hypothetical protein